MAPSIVDEARVAFVREDAASGARVFAASLHPELTVGFIPFGGFQLSVIVSACQAAVKDTPLKDAIHVTAYFLQSSQVGACEVHVRFIKSGKAFHNLEARLVQNDQTRVTAHLIFGRLSPAYMDPHAAPKLTLTPATPMYRRTPVCHPGTARAFTFGDVIHVGKSLLGASDDRYYARNARKLRENTGEDIDTNGVLEFGAVYQFLHDHDELNQVTIPIVADLHRSAPALLKELFPEYTKRQNWYPTMVLAIEFKHSIPVGPSFARNMAAIYCQTRDMTDGRHDVLVEVWSAPPGAPANPSAAPVEEGWRDKMVCLAIATQMSLSMTPEANQRRGKKAEEPKL